MNTYTNDNIFYKYFVKIVNYFYNADKLKPSYFIV